MNVAILSINLHTKKLNYGAVLHSWYFQKLMSQRADIEICDVIDYMPPLLENRNMRMNTLTFISLKKPRMLIRNLLITPAYMRRYARFEWFIRREMRITKECYTHERLKDASLPYDVIVFESDVIWAPNYFGGRFDPAFFGAMDSMRNMRRIAYSASMGNAKLTDEQKDECRGLLQSLDAVSMRETYASALIRSLTDKPVADVVDPVLLADPAEFDEITSRRIVKRDYLLVYFPINPDPYIIGCAHRYAKKHGLQVVEVSCQPVHFLRNKTYAGAGIEDFLSLIRNASVVFSNSLHGTCLSLLFHRPFYAFDRHGGEKYRDLCRKFALEDRFVANERFVEATPIDWPRIDSLRAKYRAESLAWLDGQLKAARAAAD